jgi:hypothetical protein
LQKIEFFQTKLWDFEISNSYRIFFKLNFMLHTNGMLLVAISDMVVTQHSWFLALALA